MLCHSNQDEHHQTRLRREATSFVTKYKGTLLKIKHPYIEKYLREGE